MQGTTCAMGSLNNVNFFPHLISLLLYYHEIASTTEKFTGGLTPLWERPLQLMYA